MSTRPSQILQIILGAIIVLGFQVALAVSLFYDIPQGNRDIVVYLIGQLAGAFLSVVGFAFGSSLGSQRKDEIRASPTFQPTQPQGATK